MGRCGLATKEGLWRLPPQALLATRNSLALVEAVRFRFQRVAGNGKGAGAAAAALESVLAGAAFALVVVWIVQRDKRRVVLIDVYNGVLREPTAAQRQEPGGIDLAVVSDKHDAPTICYTQRGGVRLAASAVSGFGRRQRVVALF